MKCGGTKKMGYMDLGGNPMSYDNPYQGMEPTSGYGTSQSSTNPPWRPKTGFGRAVQRITGIGDNKGFNYKNHQKVNRHAGKCAGKGCGRGSN